MAELRQRVSLLRNKKAFYPPDRGLALIHAKENMAKEYFQMDRWTNWPTS